MLAMRYDGKNRGIACDFGGLHDNGAAVLAGGAPSLAQEKLELLSQRGLVTAAMNNAAKHFRPQYWFGGDNPACYEPRILMDPGIVKFSPKGHARTTDERTGKRYFQYPNTWFYAYNDRSDLGRLLQDSGDLPWFSNTLYAAIHILYRMGIRDIYLVGSDFTTAAGMYPHKTSLGDKETDWNRRLYESQVRDLRMLKPKFDEAGLRLWDCSEARRLTPVFGGLGFDDAIARCLRGFPESDADPETLPHCSKVAKPGAGRNVRV